MAVDIEAINRNRGWAVTGQGEKLHVTTWLNEDGDDCAANDAVVAVAGPDEAGKWYSIDLREFESALLN